MLIVTGNLNNLDLIGFLTLVMNNLVLDLVQFNLKSD